MFSAFLFLPFAFSALGSVSQPREDGLERTDCQIQCPPSSQHGRVILPAITQVLTPAGEWENVLECWSVDTISTGMPDIENAFRLDWEAGFDAAYQYVFSGDSFMPSHPAPEPSLIIMASGMGDLRFPSGRCLRVAAGDVFFSVGTEGRQTAWWSNGTVVSDLYFKDGKVPEHEVVDELPLGGMQKEHDMGDL